MISKKMVDNLLKVFGTLKEEDWKVDGFKGSGYSAEIELNGVKFLINTNFMLMIDYENIPLTKSQKKIVEGYMNFLSFPFINGKETSYEKDSKERKENLIEKIKEVCRGAK